MEDAPTAVQVPLTHGRWGTVAWVACSALLVAVVVGIWLKVDQDRAGANLANAVISGDRPAAPALPATAIAGDGAPGLPDWYRASGDRQDPKAADSRVLVVNWWASWCGPCEDEAPVLAKLAKDYEGRVQVVGLDAGSKDLERDARAFVRRHRLGDLSIVRGDQADEDAWGVNGFPETFVVGTDGHISSYINGPIDAETIRGLVDAELAQERS